MKFGNMLLISLILEVKLLKLKVKYDFRDMHYIMKYVKLLVKYFTSPLNLLKYVKFVV